MGRLNVRAMLREISYLDFQDWMRYATIEPFDETRADARAALIAQVIANVNRGKNSKAFTMADFMLLKEDAVPAEKPDWRVLKQRAIMAAAIYNAAPGKE